MEKSNFTFMLVEECKYNGRLAEYHNILHKLYAIPKENELRLPPFSIAIQGTYYNDEGPIEKKYRLSVILRGKNEKEGREIATEGVEWSKIQYSGACVAEYFSEIEIEDIEVYTLGDHFFEMWVSENGVSSLTSIKNVPVFIDPDCIKKKEE